MAGLVRVTDSSSELITASEAKDYCNIEVTDFDDIVTSLITAVRTHAEEYTQRVFIYQIWRLTLDCFPLDNGGIILPKSPLSSVTSLQYYDENGDLQTWSSSNYDVDTDSEPGWIVPAYGEVWPTTIPGINTVKITYQAGYSNDRADIDEALKLAVKFGVSWLFEHRGDTEVMFPPLFYSLLNPYKVCEYQ